MKTLDKVLIIVGGFIAAFIVATVIIYTYNGWPYDTLIPCVVGSGLLETVNTMLITVTKIKKGAVNEDADNDIECSGVCDSVRSMGVDFPHDTGTEVEEDI